MRLPALQKHRRPISCLAICAIAAFTLQWSCSTANEAGRCTSYESPKYVAALTDTDGKPWEIVVQPKVGDFTCDFNSFAAGAKRPRGKIFFSAVIMDGQKQTKPALAVQARFSGLAGETLDEKTEEAGIYGNSANGDDERKAEQDDVATDACGVATFTFEYLCPDARKSIGGSLFIQSGPLFSEPIKVTIENTVQDPPVSSTTPAPAPGGGGGG